MWLWRPFPFAAEAMVSMAVKTVSVDGYRP